MNSLACAAEPISSGICIHGGTSAGVVAAIQVASSGIQDHISEA